MTESLTAAAASLSIDPCRPAFLESDSNDGSVLVLLGDEEASSLPADVQRLTFPKLPPCSLTVIPGRDENPLAEPSVELFESTALPAAASNLLCGTLNALERLTSGDSKVVYRAKLMSDSRARFQPGDSLALLCPNSSLDVNWLLGRVDLGPVSNPDSPLVVQSAGVRPAPTWLLPGSYVSARFLLTYCCELHIPVSRRVTRLLADCCFSDPKDSFTRRQFLRLLQFSSREGNELFDKFIHRTDATLFDLLCSFPACRIPLSRLLEILPRLQPRAYTLISLDQELCVTDSGRDVQALCFLFTRVDFPSVLDDSSSGLLRYQHRKHGLCTGWLEHIWRERLASSYPHLYFYIRRNLNGFRLPDDVYQPVIMVAAGTGLAPFISFIRRHRVECLKRSEYPPRLWLIFGCRSPTTSLLLAAEIANALSDGVLYRCCLCFSRHPTDSEQTVVHDCVPAELQKACLHAEARYVQDCISLGIHQKTLTREQTALTDLIIRQNAKIMVCGESKGMAPAVAASWARLVGVALRYTGDEKSAFDLTDADLIRGQEFIKRMRREKRYVEDIWT
ncbi:methionine synthase reductase [Paragonimus westermani]|uniref:Methionine synthase reductase n=1 Tax=Paragonimus westermani TaxID=34504 RepID=A0A5J4N8K0_9TREM|nr:methionine synthase reductase [Paragonimus westermani]